MEYQKITSLLVNIPDKVPATIHRIFSCKTEHYGKSSISIFQQFFASIDTIFILGGKLGTRL